MFLYYICSEDVGQVGEELEQNPSGGDEVSVRRSREVEKAQYQEYRFRSVYLYVVPVSRYVEI